MSDLRGLHPVDLVVSVDADKRLFLELDVVIGSSSSSPSPSLTMVSPFSSTPSSSRWKIDSIPSNPTAGLLNRFVANTDEYYRTGTVSTELEEKSRGFNSYDVDSHNAVIPKQIGQYVKIQYNSSEDGHGCPEDGQHADEDTAESDV